MSADNACLAGEWTIHAIARQHQAVLAMVQAGEHAFDASGITDMDTAGLQLLIAMRRGLAMRGHELKLLQPSGAVRDVLKAYGLDAELQPAEETTP